MVIFLQGTFTPLVHAHAGRTKASQNRPAGWTRFARLCLRRYMLNKDALIKYRVDIELLFGQHNQMHKKCTKQTARIIIIP